MDSVLDYAVPIGFLAFFVFVAVSAYRHNAKRQAFAQENAERSEAMFQSMFPDLQPHFHPARLVEYVAARRARQPPKGGFTWKRPPGFAAADAADIQLDGGRERVRLLDAAGALLGEFLFEEHPEGGVLRVGNGKFTVNTRDAIPRVRYWHPEREFKWKRNQWQFVSRMADQSIDSSERGTSWSSDSSSSASRAGGAALAGAGGTFDGGGASQGWDAGGASKGGASSSGTSY